MDNEGAYYDEITSSNVSTNYVIGTDGGGCTYTCMAVTTDDESIDLLDMGTNYLATIPQDPKTGTESITDYYFILRLRLG